MNKKEKITVAVSGLNNTDNPGPGIPVIRGLLEAQSFEARIIGLSYEQLEPGIYMPGHTDSVYTMPYPSAGMQVVMDRLAYINSRENIDVLIPNFDSELLLMIKMKDRLKAMGINTFLPSLEQFEERHKTNLPEFGKKYGVKVPASLPVSSVSDIIPAMKEIKYPVMVKGKFYDAYLANTYEEAVGYFYKLSAKWGYPVVFQEHVSGTEVNVIALGDGRGTTIAAVPIRKQYITDKGKAWGGIAISGEDMLQLTDHIISQTKWGGGMELELIRTNDDELYLIEINPRIPAWVYLAVGAGQNIPEALVKLAMGMDVQPFETFRVGTMFVRYSYDLIADFSDFENITTKGELIKRRKNGEEEI
jgi:carbamoyl-phosphate synthase large subunit